MGGCPFNSSGIEVQMKTALIFPGQGAQYCKMGKDFHDQFAICRHFFERAEDILKRPLRDLIFGESEELLKETRNSQLALFIVSLSILEVLKKEYGLQYTAAAGLSLGEWTALCAAGVLPFEEVLPIVALRAELMHQACEEHKGGMSVILGMSDEAVIDAVKELNIPHEICVANLNCPGQVVISGTLPAIERANEYLKGKGAKRVMPLQVHGAFHSPLMRSAQDALRPHIEALHFHPSTIKIAMNVCGHVVSDLKTMRANLIAQVTSSVHWHACVEALSSQVERFIEIGPGKTLSGMNKRIGVAQPTWNIETVADLQQFEQV